MPSQTLKLFYKGGKLSVLRTGDDHHTVISATNLNLCETNSQTAQTQLLATDSQDSTVIIYSGNQAGITYGPYGNDSCTPAAPLISRFTGQSWLPSAIGYLLGNGHRLFNPCLMRFYSADSLSPFGKGGINAYAYCSNDPVNRSDPGGRYASPIKWLKGGYSYAKLSPKLFEPSYSFSVNEHLALGKSLDKRLSGARSKLRSDPTKKSAEQIQYLNKIIAELDHQKLLHSKLSALPSTNWRYAQSVSEVPHSISTSQLFGNIPVRDNPNSQLADKILAPLQPDDVVHQIPENVLMEDLLERLRRLRGD